MPTTTATAPAPRRRRGGYPPKGPNGLVRDKLVAVRVDEIELGQVHDAVGQLGYAPDNTGVRDLLLALTEGKVRLVAA